MKFESLEELKKAQKKLLDDSIEAVECLTHAGDFIASQDGLFSLDEQATLRNVLEKLYSHVGYLAAEYFSQKPLT